MEVSLENRTEEYFQKCGEALVSFDHSLFALNCCFCMAVFVHLEEFQKHILEMHCNELAEGFANTSGNTEVAGHMEECANENTECSDDVDMVISEECIVAETLNTVNNGEDIQIIPKELLEFAEKEKANNAVDIEHAKGTTKDFKTSFVVEVAAESAIFEVREESNAAFTDPQISVDEILEEATYVDSCHVEENPKRHSRRVHLNEKNFLESLAEKVQTYPELWNSSNFNFSNKEHKKKVTQNLIKLMQNEYPRRIIRPKYIAALINKMKDGLNGDLHTNKNDVESLGTIEQQTEDCTTSAMVTYELSDATDLHLLKLYKQQPCLWNLQHSKFNDKAARNLAYLQIIRELKCLVHASEKSQLKFNKLRMRIAELCDWYKAQLRSKFRCKMLGKAFELNEHELLFKQFEFLQSTFEPSIQKENEFKIRDEVEAQYFGQDEIFSNGDSTSKSFAGSSDEMVCQASRNMEDPNATEVKEATFYISSISQERIETTRLIETYQKFPILWNPHTTESNPFKAKRKAFENIAKILTNEYLMPMSSELVRQKIKNLRQQYKEHLKKTENGNNSKLWYIPLLESFLKEHINTSLRKGNSTELVRKMPAALDLPFRFDENMPLNLHLIEILHNSTSIWQSTNLTFQVSTKLLQNLAFQEMLHELNTNHALQLDENNLLLLLHDLCEWFKREKARQEYCNEQEPDTQSTYEASSTACWEKMQFLMDYTFLADAYTCMVCNKTTNSIHGYLIDNCRHASLPPHKCFYCDKRFVDLSNCRTHECRIHTKIFNYTCEYCGKKFAHSTDELLHRRRFHTQERPFVCEICGKSFVASHDMKRHRNWHLQKQDFKCNKCGLNFYVRNELQLHKLRYHSQPESNKICKMCGRSFFTAWKLKKHLLVECKQKK